MLGGSFSHSGLGLFYFEFAMTLCLMPNMVGGEKSLVPGAMPPYHPLVRTGNLYACATKTGGPGALPQCRLSPFWPGATCSPLM